MDFTYLASFNKHQQKCGKKRKIPNKENLEKPQGVKAEENSIREGFGQSVSQLEKRFHQPTKKVKLTNSISMKSSPPSITLAKHQLTQVKDIKEELTESGGSSLVKENRSNLAIASTGRLLSSAKLHESSFISNTEPQRPTNTD